VEEASRLVALPEQRRDAAATLEMLCKKGARHPYWQTEEPGEPRRESAARFFMESPARTAQIRRTMKSVTLLLALLLLGGCASSMPKPVRSAAKAEDKRVVIDPALKGIVRVNEVLDLPSAPGFLQFQVNVENLGPAAITILYQVDWLDADGASLGILMDEPPCTLFRKEVHPIAITSPAASAKSFRLTIRPRLR